MKIPDLYQTTAYECFGLGPSAETRMPKSYFSIVAIGYPYFQKCKPHRKESPKFVFNSLIICFFTKKLLDVLLT